MPQLPRPRSARRTASTLALLLFGAATSLSAQVEAAGDLTITLDDGSRVLDPEPQLLRRDAPVPPGGSLGNQPFDPADPSTALAYNFTQQGVNFNGIGQLWTRSASGVNSFSTCTASRIGARTMVAAAHCVTDHLTGALRFGAANPTLVQNGVFSGFVDFMGPGSTTSTRSITRLGYSNVRVRSDWTGFNGSGNTQQLWKDIAVINFATALPDWMPIYSLFSANPVGQTSLHVGYGTYGTGTGATASDSRRRWGTNQVDNIGGSARWENVLMTDFDNGSPEFDTYCKYFGVCDQGTTTEAGTAPGDSGGPIFIGGAIAGVASFGSAYCKPGISPCQADVADPTRPSNSFGAVNGFAPISNNLDFIQSATVPEPSTLVLMSGGLLVVVGIGMRRRQQA